MSRGVLTLPNTNNNNNSSSNNNSNTKNQHQLIHDYMKYISRGVRGMYVCCIVSSVPYIVVAVRKHKHKEQQCIL